MPGVGEPGQLDETPDDAGRIADAYLLHLLRHGHEHGDTRAVHEPQALQIEDQALGLAVHGGIDGRADLLGIGDVKIAGKPEDERSVLPVRFQPRCGGPGLSYLSHLVSNRCDVVPSCRDGRRRKGDDRHGPA